ncbi:MAG: undecaprenyl/decaprenyl-phosphate alpha-N-acetylglucosaminyl 1-phosphate transferase [Treponema sp.]|nr:undecaprenyl/decaprenyl-phosphate alpha-N-acetylglucosaminyl 1-phosphate transferase [Treponema sp.]
MLINVTLVIVSFLLSLLSMPIIIKFCQRKKLYDYHDERKIHSGDIPRLGGFGVFFASIICIVIFLLLNPNVSTKKNFPIILSAVIVFVFAFLDDIFTFPAIVKLIVQLCATGIVSFSGYRFTQIFGWQLPTILSFILTFGWILGLINAYNLIDGLDGLCGSLSITAITTLGILFTLSGREESFICYILAAAILGFLCFNWPPAKIFMGDCGSQFLGFMIAIIPLYNSTPEIEYNKFIIMIVLTSFPIFDTIAAIWRRKREHRSIMSPDKAHLHHKLLNMGYSGRSALFYVLSLQLIICAFVIASYFIHSFMASVVLALCLVLITWVFTILHYSNRRINMQKDSEEA